MFRPAVHKVTMFTVPFFHGGLPSSSVGHHLVSPKIQDGGTWKSQEDVDARDILWAPCEFAKVPSDTMVCRLGTIGLGQ